MLTHSAEHVLILGGGCAIGMALTRGLVAAGIRVTLTVSAPEKRATLQTVLQDLPVPPRIVALSLEEPDSGLQALCAPNGAGGGTEDDSELPRFVVDCVHPHLEGYVSATEPEAATDYFAAAISGRQHILHRLTRGMLAASRSALRGRLLYLSSTAAIMPNPGQGLYAASKQAAEALYRSIGIELAPRGITTAIVRAGYVDAGRGREYLAAQPQVLDSIPLKRALYAQEVAAMLFWLLSDQAVGVNATAITMDGGMTACK